MNLNRSQGGGWRHEMGSAALGGGIACFKRLLICPAASRRVDRAASYECEKLMDLGL